MEALLRRWGLTGFPISRRSRRDPRNFLAGLAAFIREFREKTFPKPRWLSLARPWWSSVDAAKLSQEEKKLLERRRPLLVAQR